MLSLANLNDIGAPVEQRTLQGPTVRLSLIIATGTGIL